MAVLIWSFVPASLADIFVDPKWFAPHWQCDSLGIPIYRAQQAALPVAGIAIVISGLLTFVTTRKRLGGRDIFDFRLRKSLWDWSVTLVAVMLILILAEPIVRYLHEATFIQTRTADCGGTSEEITVSGRRPFLQYTPVIYALLILWLLHLRAFAVSPKRGPEPKPPE